MIRVIDPELFCLLKFSLSFEENIFNYNLWEIDYIIINMCIYLKNQLDLLTQ